MKIMVAISGGVDSSTVAHILKNEGHEVVGAMMEIWSDPLGECTATKHSACCNEENIGRAKFVCEQLKIPFYHINLTKEFKDSVLVPFLDSYSKGKTPNPCVMCNKTIKFGALLKEAQKLDCDYVATGHYARIIKDKSNLYHLLKPIDKTKDQSYFLYNLTQDILKKVLFPLGLMHKKDVFKLAKKFNIPIPKSYNETQDVCFIPEKGPNEFLKRYLPNIKMGNICTEDGNIIGKHKGLPFYTIGQRSGLGIGGLKIPLHVSRKDADTNTIYVAESGADYDLKLNVNKLNWICNEPDDLSNLHARINSLGQITECKMEKSETLPKVTFFKPIRGIANDQSIVFYEKEEILGGGIIVRD